MASVVELQKELHELQPAVETMVLGFELEALLGRHQMYYLDRSQGPPAYPCFEGVKHVITSLDETLE
ncbi:hypothetical protein Hanom_Chr00s041069g01774421 [Helianthus anomalus]